MGWLKAESEDSLGEWELAGGGEDRKREGSEGNCLDKCTRNPQCCMSGCKENTLSFLTQIIKYFQI